MTARTPRKLPKPNFSVTLKATLTMLDEAARDYTWNQEEVYRLEALTQDLLHELELGELTYAQRAKIATKLAETRKLRRASKDTVEILTPVIDFINSERGKKMLDLLREALGQTRKIEERMKNRTYRYRVLESIKAKAEIL